MCTVSKSLPLIIKTNDAREKHNKHSYLLKYEIIQFKFKFILLIKSWSSGIWFYSVKCVPTYVDSTKINGQNISRAMQIV